MPEIQWAVSALDAANCNKTMLPELISSRDCAYAICADLQVARCTDKPNHMYNSESFMTGHLKT